MITLCQIVKAQNNTASSIMDSLKQVLKTTRIDTIKLSALNSLAWEEFSLSRKTGEDKDSIIRKYANEALRLSKKFNNKYQQGLAIYTLASMDRRDGHFSEALKKYYAVIKLSEEIDDKLCKANQYSNIGDMYSILGNMQDAINNHLKAIKIFEQIGDKNWLLYSYNRIGNIYGTANRHGDALKYYLLALSVARQLNSKEEEAKCYVSLAGVHLSSGQLTEARKYYSLAMEIFKDNETQFPDECYNIFLGMGWINYGEAFFNKTSNAKESYLEALPNFQKALQFAKLTRSKWYLNEAYKGLANTYQQIQDYKNALEYTLLQYQVKDSLFNKESMDKIAKLKTEYEQQKQEIEEKARQQVFLAQLKELKSKMSEQKLQEELALATEKNLHEKELTDQKIEQAKKAAEVKTNYEKSIAFEKQRQERMKDRQQRNNFLILTSLAGLITISIFVILLLRQKNLRKRAIEHAETIHKMAELELQSLRSQLNPHFMFNSLNAIQELILLEENDRSHIYLSRFSKLLRMLLDNADHPFISLRNEIEFLRLYLDLESLRVPDLNYSISTDPDLDTYNLQIPNLILQPYIENAIWHGLSYKDANKQLQIRIYQVDETIHCEIEDNGVGRKKAQAFKSQFRQKHHSKGMELLNKRFKLLNEEYSSNICSDISDVIKNNEVAGTLVTIKIPVSILKLKPALS